MKKIIVIGSILSSIVFTAFGDTHYVSKNGSDIAPFDTLENGAWKIQSAINLAVDGDTVLVDDGTYVLDSSISITKNITVKSINGASKVIIDGHFPIRSITCITIANAEPVLDGFTIQNGGYGGLYVSLCNATVKNCVIHHNQRYGYYSFGEGFAYNLTIAYNQGTGYYAYRQFSVVSCAVNFIIYGNDQEFFLDGCGLNGPDPVWYTNNPSFYSTNDFRLRPESPCINAGDTHSWMYNETAAGGNHRVIDGAVDMGAYEYTPPPQMQGIYQAIEINWTSTLGVDYQVQYTTNLTSGVWIDLCSVAGNGGTATAFDSTRTNASKVYRVVAK